MMRLTIIIALAIGLSFLCYWGAIHSPWLLLGEAMTEPEKYDGAIVNQFLYPRITEIYSDGFQLTERGNRSIRVYSDTSGLILGKWVGLEAIYHKEGYLIAKNVRVAKNRAYKVYLSLIPAILILWLCLLHFRVDWKSKTIQLRTYA